MRITTDIKKLTAIFRGIMRDENPLWEHAEYLAWTWNNGPEFNCEKVLVEMHDDCFPGGSAINKMYGLLNFGQDARLTFLKYEFIA